MPFTENEFSVGMIAYFSVDQLRANNAIRRTGGSPNADPRPFMAYAQDEAGHAYWTPLTLETTQGDRTEIESAWLTNPSGRFRTAKVFVNDGGHTYAGAVKEFAELSKARDQMDARRRTHVSEDGIEAVSKAVRSRNGLLPLQR